MRHRPFLTFSCVAQFVVFHSHVQQADRACSLHSGIGAAGVAGFALAQASGAFVSFPVGCRFLLRSAKDFG